MGVPSLDRASALVNPVTDDVALILWRIKAKVFVAFSADEGQITGFKGGSDQDPAGGQITGIQAECGLAGLGRRTPLAKLSVEFRCHDVILGDKGVKCQEPPAKRKGLFAAAHRGEQWDRQVECPLIIGAEGQGRLGGRDCLLGPVAQSEGDDLGLQRDQIVRSRLQARIQERQRQPGQAGPAMRLLGTEPGQGNTQFAIHLAPSGGPRARWRREPRAARQPLGHWG